MARNQDSLCKLAAALRASQENSPCNTLNRSYRSSQRSSTSSSSISSSSHRSLSVSPTHSSSSLSRNAHSGASSLRSSFSYAPSSPDARRVSFGEDVVFNYDKTEAPSSRIRDRLSKTLVSNTFMVRMVNFVTTRSTSSSSKSTSSMAQQPGELIP